MLCFINIWVICYDGVESRINILCCPKCKSDLIERDNFLVCDNCGGKYEIIDDNIVKIIPDLTSDLELSIKKWDAFY